MSTFASLILRGTRAAQPAASAVPTGTLYFVTDEFFLERSSGSAWQSQSAVLMVGDSGSGGTRGLVPAPGSGDTASGKFLKADATWAVPPGSGGGLTLIEQHTASSSATLDFTTAFTSTYDEYLIEGVNLIPATNGVQAQLRVSTNGGVSYDSGTNYQWCVSIQTPAGGTGFTAVASATGATSILPAGANNVANTAAGGGIRFSLRLFDPLSATANKDMTGIGSFRNSGDSSDYRLSMGGYYISTTAVNALRFLFSSGNIASGTIRIYGLAK